MGRPKKINDAPSAEIKEKFLQQNPEGLPDKIDPVVVMDHVPEYRRVIFLNGRDPGQILYHHYASKTHPLKHYELHHGFEHNLPVEVIEHLEECGDVIYGIRMNQFGASEIYPKAKKYLFAFKTVNPNSPPRTVGVA